MSELGAVRRLESLSAREQQLLLESPASGAALAAVALFAADEHATTADAVASVSFEAAGASTGVLETEFSDVRRPHAGQVASAANMRLLLSASKRTNKAHELPQALQEALQTSHEHHGAARDGITAAMRAVRVELNATPAVAQTKRRNGGDSREYHPAPLARALHSLLLALQELHAASLARHGSLHALVPGDTGRVPPDMEAFPVSHKHSVTIESSRESVLALAMTCIHEESVLRTSFVQELMASDRLLVGEEEEAEAAQHEKEMRRQQKQRDADRREAEQAERRRAEIAAIENAEERARAERTFAQQQEKAAEKKAKKLSKGAASAMEKNLLGMGKGTAEMRVWVRERADVRYMGDPEGVSPISAVHPHAGATGTRLDGATLTLLLDPWTARPSTTVPEGAVLEEEDAMDDAGPGTPVPGAGAAPPTTGPRRQPQRGKRPHDDVTLASWLHGLLEQLGSGGLRKPKVAKGARDYMPEQMEVRERCFHIIRSVFKRHGAVEIDTPVFERKETLLGKYGDEGGKLIYDLADQGGELLSLRYDLTVPFARFVAQHRVRNIKRYHIARVYRRDQPNMNKGRYREFYQCDFDIAGNYAQMMPDAEVIKVACEILEDLPIGPFKVKLNHRVLLDGMLEIAGVHASKFKSICSAIDKLDKESWETVRDEMVTEKGLAPETADRIGEMVLRAGAPRELYQQLKDDGVFASNEKAHQALEQLRVLFEYLDAMDCLDRVSFDLSLARGLDYYTGVIYEAVLDSTTHVGSIAAGGRYDNLVGDFSATGEQVPCVGVSIGIERIFSIMEANATAAGGLRRTPVQVFVASVGANLTKERLALCGELWAAGITAEMMYSENPKMPKQLQHVLEAGNPFMVVIGEDEVRDSRVTLKKIESQQQETVARSAMIDHLKAWGVRVQSREEVTAAQEQADAARGGAGE